MRVLHINVNYISRPLHQLMVEKLDTLGVESKVFVPTYNKDTCVISPNENVTICECFKKWDRVFFDGKQRKIVKAAENNFCIDDYDLIHAYTLFTDGNAARKLSKKYNVPYVVAVRNTDVYGFFKLFPHLRKRGVKILLDAKKVFFLSEGYKKTVFDKYIPQKYHRMIEEKTLIVPNGIDDFWFDNPPVEKNRLSEKIKLLYVGRIYPNKNISSTQKAMELLRGKGYDVSLTVVGPVNDEQEYELLKQDPYTEFLPSMSKEELVHIYRKHNIFIMPSFTEAFGLVYAEAMSQGLPVIYSKGQGFDNQFPEGCVGYHVSPNDISDVANGLEILINNFARVSENVISASKKFNWEKIAQVYCDAYNQFK